MRKKWILFQTEINDINSLVKHVKTEVLQIVLFIVLSDSHSNFT